MEDGSTAVKRDTRFPQTIKKGENISSQGASFNNNYESTINKKYAHETGLSILKYLSFQIWLCFIRCKLLPN